MCNCSRSLPQLDSQPLVEQNSQSSVFIICMIIFGSIVFFIFIWIAAFCLMKYRPLKSDIAKKNEKEIIKLLDNGEPSSSQIRCFRDYFTNFLFKMSVNA
jgi:hypothetical protein